MSIPEASPHAPPASLPPAPSGGGRVAVSIVSHGHGDAVLQLLHDLERHAAASVGTVVLTLNVDEPALATAIAAHAWPMPLRILRNTCQRGFAANHNAAYRLVADAAFFAVVNPDVRLDTDPFPALLAPLAAGAGCTFPRQVDAAGQPCNPPRVLPTPVALALRQVGIEPAAPPDWVNAAFLLFPGPVYAALGGFDEGYRLYCEDVDICLRLQLRGLPLVPVEAARVKHEGRRDSHGDWRHLAWHLAGLWRLWRSAAYRAYRADRARRARRTPA